MAEICSGAGLDAVYWCGTHGEYRGANISWTFYLKPQMAFFKWNAPNRLAKQLGRDQLFRDN